MSLTIIQMFGSVTGGTQDAMAAIDIPEDGRMVGIDWAADALLNSDGESVSAELSFISTNLLGTNDARGVISTVRARAAFVTSGLSVLQINKYVPLEDLEVSGGERIYLHASSSAGVTGTITCLVHLETRRAIPRRSRRRR